MRPKLASISSKSRGRCGVEALTYPFIKGIAARLGVSLVPLAMDEGGLRPDAVQKALDGKTPKKVIVVPGRIVNVVA